MAVSFVCSTCWGPRDECGGCKPAALCWACGGAAPCDSCSPERQAEAREDWEAEYGGAPSVEALRSAFDVTCQSCGFSGSIELVGQHDCQIVMQGGRCEDAGACNHGTEGCMPVLEGTMDYWLKLYSQNPDMEMMDSDYGR